MENIGKRRLAGFRGWWRGIISWLQFLGVSREISLGSAPHTIDAESINILGILDCLVKFFFTGNSRKTIDSLRSFFSFSIAYCAATTQCLICLKKCLRFDLR